MKIGNGTVARFSNASRRLLDAGKVVKAMSRILPTKLEIVIALGDMTRLTGLGAWVVPHFAGAVSYGGVGRAVLMAGGKTGLEALEPRIQGMQFGDVAITDAGKADVGKLIHVISVGSNRDQEFGIVQTAVKNALKAAEEAGIESVVFPALGTGIIGQLTARQSAHAMLEAISQHPAEKVKQVTVIIYGNESAYHEFVRVYQNPTERVSTVGEKEFNAAAWAVGMTIDLHAHDILQMSENQARHLGAKEIRRILDEHNLPEAIDAFAEVVGRINGEAESKDAVKEALDPIKLANRLRDKYKMLEDNVREALVDSALQAAREYLFCFE